MNQQMLMQAMQQMQQMQQKVEEARRAVAQMTISEEVGGGSIRVTATGAGRISKIEINPEAISADDREMLEDMVIAAVNKALDSAQAMADRAMEQATAGMMPNIPGLPGLFG